MRSSAHPRLSGLSLPLDRGWCPRSVHDRCLGPVGAHVERDVTILRRRQPVRALVWAGRRVGLHIDRQRAVSIELQPFVLRADGVSPLMRAGTGIATVLFDDLAPTTAPRRHGKSSRPRYFVGRVDESQLDMSGFPRKPSASRQDYRVYRQKPCLTDLASSTVGGRWSWRAADGARPSAGSSSTTRADGSSRRRCQR